MKRSAIAVATALAIAPAFAQYDGPYSYRSDNTYSYTPNNTYQLNSQEVPAAREEYARVIESRPVYASSKEECWNPRTQAFEERRDSSSGIGKGAAIGAVAGGVLGHQIDHGEGTAAGAILGGILGHQLEKRSDRGDDLDTSRCRVASDSSNIEGYDVRYRYKGTEYTTRMAYDPGRRLLVGQDVNWDGTPFA
jgi:uncharacterized protein YcfJ